MNAEIYKLSDPAGSVILRLFGWDEAARDAVANWQFDGVNLTGDMGSFEPLTGHAERVRWLYIPSVESSAGLAELQAIRRITFSGELPKPRFDLRVLPQLQVLECDVASGLDARTLNHPQLRYLDLEGLKAVDLRFLSDARDLEAMRLRCCGLRSLDGLEVLSSLTELRLLGAKKLEDVSALRQARQLEILEIDAAKKLTDVSAIAELPNLRYLFIDAEHATQSDWTWLSNCKKLECAGLWLKTEKVDWSIVASMPRLYDIVLFTHAGFELPPDEELIPVLQTAGKQVLNLTRFPKAFMPGIRIEFRPPDDLSDPKPLFVYQTNLLAACQ